MKIKKDDKVIVIAGKDKGKTGKVLRALPKLDKVVVEGVNVAKKHIKYKFGNKKGEIVDVNMPIHVSNVSLTKADKKSTETKTTKKTTKKK